MRPGGGARPIIVEFTVTACRRGDGDPRIALLCAAGGSAPLRASATPEVGHANASRQAVSPSSRPLTTGRPTLLLPARALLRREVPEICVPPTLVLMSPFSSPASAGQPACTEVTFTPRLAT